MRLIVVVAVVLMCRPCCSRSVAEEASVVSVYTTQPTTAGIGFDVYQQIANNIAERITSPIYRFLGFGNNTTRNETTTKRPWEKIELLDESPEEVTKPIQPVDNTIEERDIEELSVEALKKIDKKPEKVTLYSSYLPAKEKLANDSIEFDDDEPFEFDDDDDVKPRQGLVYVLEWFGSMFQLIWGALSSVFTPSSNKDDQRRY